MAESRSLERSFSLYVMAGFVALSAVVLLLSTDPILDLIQSTLLPVQSLERHFDARFERAALRIGRHVLMMAAPLTLLALWCWSAPRPRAAVILWLAAILLWTVGTIGLVGARNVGDFYPMAWGVAAVGLLSALPVAAAAASRVPGNPEAPGEDAVRFFWALAIGILILGLLLRTPGFFQPIQRDVAIWLTIAENWLAGEALYLGGWDHKPPMAFIPWALPFLIAEDLHLGLFVFGAVLWLLTGLGILALATNLGGRGAGLAALLAWAFLGNDPLLEANRAHGEAIINICVVWALALLSRQAWPSLADTVAAGMLLACTTLMKQHMILVPAALAVLYLGRALAAAPALRAALLRHAAIVCGTMAAIGAAAWGLVFAYTWASGSLDAFFYANFEYLLLYASENDGQSASLERLSRVNAIFLLYLAAALLPLGLLLLRVTRFPESFLLAAFLSAAVITVMPMRFYQHYMQIMVPTLCVGLAVLLGRAFAGTKNAARLQLLGALILCLPMASVHAFTNMTQMPNLSLGFAPGRHAEARDLGLKLNDAVSEEQGLFHYGSEPAIYLYAGQRSPTRFVFSIPLRKVSHPRQEMWLGEVVEMLEADRPEIVVFSRENYWAKNDPVTAWVLERYEPATTFGEYEYFHSYRRR